MKSLFLSLFFLAPLLAHADIYDDRIQAEEQRQVQAELQQRQLNASRADKYFARDLYRFADAHSGLAEPADCNSFGSTHESWGMSTRQACDGANCISVKIQRRDSSQDPQTLMMELADDAIYFCHIVLNNGLACSVSNTGSKDQNFGGDCIDEAGHSTHYEQPSTFRYGK
jgi:hypothetical protein